MKICHVVSSKEPLDVRVFHKLARPTAAAGHRVTVIAPGSGPPTVDGVAFRYVPTCRSRLLRLLRSPLLLQRALAMPADVYHVHDPEFLLWAALLQALSGRPVVYDVREYWADKLLHEEWLPAFWRALVARPAALLERALGRCLAGVTVTMAGQARLYQRQGRPPATVVLHNYPDLSQAEGHLSAALRGGWSQPTVIYLGWMVRLRGYETLLQATELIQWAAPAVRVVLLGPSREDGLSAAASALRCRLIRQGVLTVGEVPYPMVWRHLSLAHVGWIPWLPAPNMEKILPVKLLEYMAVGLPVVASDFGLMARLIRHADCGLVAPAGDPQAHADAIAWLIANPTEAERLGRNGQEYVRGRFDLRSELPRMWDLYRSLADARGGRSTGGTR
ncbi:MAG: glycosyltransferase [Dehalococcoidia bacterium]